MLILIKSSKGEDQFISNNQIFGKHRKTKSNRVWRCILQLCPSTALRFLEYTEESSDFVLIKQHNHLEPGILCRKRIIITKMKILILKSGLPPFQAVYSILGGAAYEIIGDLVPLSNIYRMLRDYKWKKSKTPFIPGNKLYHNLSVTHPASNFTAWSGNWQSISGLWGQFDFFFSGFVINLLKTKEFRELMVHFSSHLQNIFSCIPWVL